MSSWLFVGLPRLNYTIAALSILLQGFEKMMLGMYLGDLVRRVILRMSQESDIFGPVSSRLSVPFILRYVFFTL